MHFVLELCSILSKVEQQRRQGEDRGWVTREVCGQCHPGQAYHGIPGYPGIPSVLILRRTRSYPPIPSVPILAIRSAADSFCLSPLLSYLTAIPCMPTVSVICDNEQFSVGVGSINKKVAGVKDQAANGESMAQMFFNPPLSLGSARHCT